MKEIIEDISNKFIKHYKDLDYKQCKSVNITSGVDDSVVLIGSTISVLKPMLLNEQIDKNGVFLLQRAIRTRGLKNERVLEKTEWASYFDASGVLVNYNSLDRLIYDTIEFINKGLDIDYKDVMIRVLSSDTDLIKCLANIDSNVKIEFDSRPEKYYKHRYGLDELGIFGRNFNIAIKEPNSEEYKDIGNIIVIESSDKKYGAESAIGINAMIMRKYGIDNSIDSSSIVDVHPTKELSDYKFLDCLSVVSHLANENILSIKKRSPEYLYKKYLKSLLYWSEQKGIKEVELLKLIKEYLLLEYKEYNDVYIENNVIKQLVKIKKGGF